MAITSNLYYTHHNRLDCFVTLSPPIGVECLECDQPHGESFGLSASVASLTNSCITLPNRTTSLQLAMSADLFAEFSTTTTQNQKGQTGSASKAQPASTFSFFDDLSSQASIPVPHTQPPPFTQNFGTFTTNPTQAPIDDDADDWGDFEGGTGVAGSAAQPDPFASVSSQKSQPQRTTQPMKDDIFGSQSAYPSQTSQGSWSKAPIVRAKKPTDSNVLFDAEQDFDDDDDFGDFEDSQFAPAPTVASAPAAAPAGGSSNLVDLLGDLDLSQPTYSTPPKPSQPVKKLAPKSPETTKKGAAGGFGAASNSTKQKSKPTPAPTPDTADDGWDTFDDWEASIPAPAAKKPEATRTEPPTTSSAPAPILSSTAEHIPPQEQPPTNVPPPGVLLSLFPSFFADAQEKLFKPMAAQPLPMRNKLLADTGTIAYLQGFIMLASVAAHIIAGRKLRWKRDQLLSQGMRIGPASSRATSGMKLTGIDRGENLKEEREASDVVRAWKDQIGRLRHVISGVNQIKAGTLSAAPDLQEAMPVRTLKQSEGGVPARQPCMLCGLKRDERVTTAEVGIEDSFGEWWIEQVNMHRGTFYYQTHRTWRMTVLLGCRNFWVEHKDRLRQR